MPRPSCCFSTRCVPHTEAKQNHKITPFSFLIPAHKDCVQSTLPNSQTAWSLGRWAWKFKIDSKHCPSTASGVMAVWICLFPSLPHYPYLSFVSWFILFRYSLYILCTWLRLCVGTVARIHVLGFLRKYHQTKQGLLTLPIGGSPIQFSLSKASIQIAGQFGGFQRCAPHIRVRVKCIDAVELFHPETKK